MDRLLQHVFSKMDQKANAERAQKMSAYMKHKFDFFGIPSPVRKEIFKELWLHEKEEVKQEYKGFINALWKHQKRESQYVATDVLRKCEKSLLPSDVPWIENLIITKPWWDTVDFLSPNSIGYLFKKHPTIRNEWISKWRNSDNIWLIRTALLFQLKYKHDMDQALIFDMAIQHKHSKEFFINKASGWALRQMAKFDMASVKHFVASNEDLPNLTKREALKHG